MPLPQIAIVGRPNVGKSSLLNRLARKQVSIVDPTPGITRDRVFAVLDIEPPLETPKGTPSILSEVVDTGGYGVYTTEDGRYDDVGSDLAQLTEDIELQIQIAAEQAAVIVFVVDAQAGVTSLDEMVANLLRKAGYADKVIVVANKVDGEEWESYVGEIAGLGMGDPVSLSAKNGYHIRNLIDAIYSSLEASVGISDAADSNAEKDFTFAIVGKRNAGKSTLLNALAGEPRAIVSEIAGTTRDSLDVRIDVEGHIMTAIDTAGLRKKGSMKEDVEYYAYRRALSAIRRADVCMFLIDASVPVSQVDHKLSQELQRQFKPTIIVVNKWDVVDDNETPTEKYLDYLTRELRGFDYAPIVFVSAKGSEGLHDLIAVALNLYKQASHRESTSSINRIIESILQKRGPTSKLGTQAKLFYVSQVATNPPSIVLIVNDPKLFKGSYERYLMNRLREELPYSEVPIRLFFRKRKRKELQQMKERAGRDDMEMEAGDFSDIL